MLVTNFIKILGLFYLFSLKQRFFIYADEKDKESSDVKKEKKNNKKNDDDDSDSDNKSTNSAPGNALNTLIMIAMTLL